MNGLRVLVLYLVSSFSFAQASHTLLPSCAQSIASRANTPLSHAELEELLEMAATEIEQLLHERNTLQENIRAIYANLKPVQTQSIDQEELLRKVANLPRKKREFLRYMQTLFPERIEVMPSAQRSLEESTFKNETVLLRMLFAVAVDLHSLYFVEKRSSCIEEDFKARTGFELAQSETGYVRSHTELARAREFEHNGKWVRADSHVKLGSREPEVLRLHYYVDRKHHRIVIFHCGNHLPVRRTKP